jgi:SAM-dependent methyltransferase
MIGGETETGTCTVAPGHYARKQLLCRNTIIAWSHQSRFRLARKLVEPFAASRLLDYGCGDGTFLAEVHDLFPTAVGADIDLNQAIDCRTRFADMPGLSFVLTNELAGAAHEGAYQVVSCMEVLEHCVDQHRDQVLLNLRRLVSPDGIVIISVPIEIGPTLIGKQIVRTLAGWRGLGDYKYNERYTIYELFRMVFAGERTAIPRPLYPNGNGSGFHPHQGFNWRTLRMRLREHFNIQQTRFSPLGWLGGYFSSQAWLICEPRKV